MREVWNEKKLGDVISLEYGKPLSKENRKTNGLYPVYGANGEKTRTDNYYYDQKSIIIGRKGSAGEINISEEKFWPLDVSYFVKFNKEKYNLFFLYYLLKLVNLPKLAKGVKPGINRNDVYDIQIKIPSLPEQQRIVSILDNAFAAINKAIANAEQNLRNCKELFESSIKEIFENNNEDWINSTIGESCDLMTGGTPNTHHPEYYNNGTIKWLVSGDINRKEIIDCAGRITKLGFENSNAKYLPVNSVLIALNGQGKTRGTVAMLRTEATCNQSLVSIYPKNDKELLTEFIFSNLEGRYNEIRKMTGDSGNDRRGLNMTLIKSIKFSYPKSVDEQRRIMSTIDVVRKKSNMLQTIYQQKLESFKELKKSILQKAFKGELEPSKKIAV